MSYLRRRRQPLQEHEDRDEEVEDRTTMRYVEAVDGQIFEIHLTVAVPKGFQSHGRRTVSDSASTWMGPKRIVHEPFIKNTDCETKNDYTCRKAEAVSVGANRVRQFTASRGLETASDGRMLAS